MNHTEIAERAAKHADAIVAAVERSSMSLEDPGICIGCGSEQGQTEPDAREYPCESCSANMVFGAQELMLHLEI